MRRRLILGPAGSGKTTLLLNEIMNTKGDVLVMAPTHKALQVIRQKLNKHNIKNAKLSTLHRGLGYKVIEEQEDGTPVFEQKSNPVDFINNKYKKVFVDEGSMITEEMLKKLLGINDLTIIGDPYQLPAVGEDVPAIIKYSNMFDVTKLDKIYRIEDEWKKNISIYPEKLNKIIKYGIKKGYIQTINRKDIAYIDWKKRDKIILAYKNSRVDFYNRKIRQLLWRDETDKPHIGEELIIMSRHKIYPVNDIIEIRHINPQVYYFITKNGIQKVPYYMINNTLFFIPDEEGVKIRNKSYRYIKEINEKEKHKIIETFPDVKYAYALTTHRSQGSEWDHVFVDIQDILSADKAIRKNLLYVAMTRFRKTITVIL